MILPGGKNKKLPQKDNKYLGDIGIPEGVLKHNTVVCVERSAWWADKAISQLPAYKVFRVQDVHIIVVDHLTKHQTVD